MLDDKFKHDTYSTYATFDISGDDPVKCQCDTDILKDGKINGIYYWYEWQYKEDQSITFNTLNSSYYYKSCSFFKSHKSVRKGEKISIFVAREECYLKVYCES